MTDQDKTYPEPPYTSQAVASPSILPEQERDERLRLPHGMGRDIAANPSFDGTTQRKVHPDHKTMLDGVAVGGAFERNETVKSFASTAIGFGGISGQIAEGAGALKGYSITCLYNAAITVPIIVNFRNRNQLGGVLLSAVVKPDNYAMLCDREMVGDFGVNYDSLYVEFLDGTTGSTYAGNAGIIGTALVASVE